MTEEIPHIILPEYEGPERRRTYQCFCHPKHQKAIISLEGRMDKSEEKLGGAVPWKIFIPIMAPLMLLFTAALWGIFDKVSGMQADIAALKVKATVAAEKSVETNEKLDKLHNQVENFRREFRIINGNQRKGG